jgi:glyoxylase-like metal-dependent hydrolase (beta-lactamase superfamily II)
MSDAIHHPFPEAPAEGEAVTIAPGILWMRLPLPMALDHVNIYALEDPDGWTLVDTGFSSRRTKAIWQRLIDGPLAGKPIRRLIVTHHHPDHIGLAGWFQAMGAELITTRTAWLLARMLVLDVQATPTPEAMQFYRRAGLGPEALAEKAAQRPFNFADIVDPMPLGFTRIDEGDILTAAGRRWQVRLGHGHAPDHATLWSLDDDLILGGDQLLPGISANIGVYPTEPEADPLGDWLASTAAFQAHAHAAHLVLPGHKLPFTGLPFRLVQMAENHHSALDRLTLHLARPQTAAQCFMPLFKREITGEAFGLALVEAVAHLNHLLKQGRISRHLDAQGAWIWQAA